MRPRIAVVTFPGSLDDGDMRLALELIGAEPVPLWHADERLPDEIGAVVLPGGFSHGDYLRCGALAKLAPVMRSVHAFATAGGPVLGVCNGFQILCEAGLLPGVLRANRQLEYVCCDVTISVEETVATMLSDLEPGTALGLPIKHGEGNWYTDDETFAEIADRGQIAFRYLADVNGSRDLVAGVCNEAGNVLGLMPHPEHAVDRLLGPVGGAQVLEGLVTAARDHLGVAA
ncbi:MAG: phosphoribosylformylglycinamidine synthase subunit PurQ [Gaiella sp.]